MNSQSLPNVLAVGVGAQVMLLKNLDVERGLFNGATGVVKKLVPNKSQPDGIGAIEVDFFGVSGGAVEVQRVTEQYSVRDGVFVERVQFPLAMSYALTVHKAQGLSLNCVVADLGKEVFKAGMAYTVLSRLRKLEGLYLLDFERSSVWADRKAVFEYNRLRAKYEPSLPMMDVPEERKIEKKAVRMLDVSEFVGREFEKGVRKESEVKKSCRSTKDVVKTSKQHDSAEVVHKVEGLRRSKRNRVIVQPDVETENAVDETVEAVPDRVVDVNIGWSDDEMEEEMETESSNVCFADVAAVALRASKSFVDWLGRRDGERKVKTILRRNGKGAGQELVKAVMEREREGEQYDDGGPHVAGKFVESLLRCCGSTEGVWEVKYKTTVVYECCRAVYEVGTKDTLVLVVEESQEPLKLEEMKSKPVRQMGDIRRCLNCGEQSNVDYYQSYEESVAAKANMVVVKLLRSWVGGNGERVDSTSTLEAVDPDRVKVGGADVKIVSAVVYEQYENVGHYKTIRRGEDGWEMVDGNEVEVNAVFPRNLANVQYFVGEKFEDCGFIGSTVVTNVVSDRQGGQAFWVTKKPNLESQLFGNSWQYTGLVMGNEYFDLPAVKPKRYVRKGKKGWVRYQGNVFMAFDVKGDGNCLFRALSLAMYGTENKHGDIRDQVVRELRNEWLKMACTAEGYALLPPLLMEAWMQMVQRNKRRMPTRNEQARFESGMEVDLGGRVNWFCDELAKDSVWGGDESLWAASRVLDLSIVVLNVDANVVVRQERPGRPEMYLRFVDGNHYHFLEPSKKCLELPVQH